MLVYIPNKTIDLMKFIRKYLAEAEMQCVRVLMRVCDKPRFLLNLRHIIRFKASRTTCRLSCGGSSK